MIEPVVVEGASSGYNAWPMVQTVGSKIVCAYSRGRAHNIAEGVRGVFARVSSDGGATWGDEVSVANDASFGEVAIGKGLDRNGAMLLWVRCWGGGNPHHDLYRTTDGAAFEKIATPALDPVPMQITDVFAVPGVGLMCLWFSDGYAADSVRAWGKLVSADNGHSWTQTTVETNLARDEWPTELSGICLGGGRILVIARCEGANHQFQITSTDSGATWTKRLTNITDVRMSTPSLVYDASRDLVSNYYYERGAKMLKRRVASVKDVFTNPTKWPTPELLYLGEETVAIDAGNVNVTVGPDGRHLAVTYTGTSRNTKVVAISGEVKTLPPWKPGELDLHFIYTGVGENTFHIYPDGTTMLLDTGDFFWPDEKKRTPFLPSAERLGGEWVARYLKRVWPKGTIDYLMVSHWHSDHTGDPAQRSRVTADGRKVCGIASVGEDFRFGTFLDHQTPRAGTYTTGNDVETMKFTLDFVERCKAKYGLRHEAFRVGAKGQIRLLHDAAKYRGAFSVRNVCANAVLWDGKDGAEDLGAVSTKGQKRPYINQNTISAALRIDYGKFSFFTGGDISRTLRDAEGKEFSYEELVGRRCGRVTVAKTNHHACGDAMSQGFIDAVGAKVYVNNVWCPSQANADTTPRMVDAGGFVYHTYQPAFFRGYLRKYPWAKGVSREFGHVVVRVAPGGETFRVFVLTAEDESMRILSEREFPSGM